MELFFNPRSVAVVGVSESADNLGRRITENLHEFCFNGIIYLVGPRGGTAFGRRILRSVADIPDQVDLAVILVPARFIPGVLEECGEKGIHHAIIESAGFSELGEEGREVEDQVVRVAAKHGIRFIGPNCIGVINRNNGLAVPFTGLKAVFARGDVSIISQSGGVGLDYLNLLASENLGLSKFISIGNKLNVNECDLLEYLVQDPDTRIICMYLEGISDGRRLMKIARSTAKPILMHKSNTGRLAQEIAKSHTSSLSGDDQVVSAALRQAGVARFADSDTLINFLKILHLPPLCGNRLAVVSRSGGHAVMAADACEKTGFDLISFPGPFLREVEKNFRARVIRLTNPLDLGDLFDFNVYTRIVDEILKLSEVDGAVLLYTYIAAVEREPSRAFLKRVEELSYAHQKPVATCVSTDGEEMSVLRKILPHPVFTTPEDTIAALALLRDSRFSVSREPVLPAGELDEGRIREILDRCRAEQRDVLTHEGLEILGFAGIPTPGHYLVTSADEAVQAYQRLAGPVVVKLVCSEISHKTDVGGVFLGLEGPDSVEEAFRQIQCVARKSGVPGPARALVQPFVKGGTEMIVGARRDRTFGPVILVGSGGIFVEVLKDVSMRVIPVDEGEVEQMLAELKVSPILTGARGRKPRDLKAVGQCLLSAARLIQAFPEIQELDINPLLVFPESQGVQAVDARIILG